MNVRDELVKDATNTIQSYINAYSKFDDIPVDRKKDIQQLWLILHEKNPVKMRKQIEKKLDAMPKGLLAFFMFDMKKLKNPLLDLLSLDKYQKEFLKYRYEKEIDSYANNQEEISKILNRVSLLENKVVSYEDRTQNLEEEVKHLAKENEFLTQKIKQLHDQNKLLQKEKKEAVLRADTAESKLLTMEENYQKLLDENKRLRSQLKQVQRNASPNSDFIIQPRTSLSSYL